MPLTAQEKNQIAQVSTTVVAAEIGALAGFGALGTGGIGILFLPLLLGLQAEFNRVHAPIGPGPIAILNQTRALQRRGLQTRISPDPFFGNTVISTKDQDANLFTFIRQAAERRVRSEFDFSPLAIARERLNEELARTAEARGFRTSIDPNLRGGVFRETAESPLQFIEGDFL